jgi:hypothetical protein
MFVSQTVHVKEMMLMEREKVRAEVTRLSDGIVVRKKQIEHT